MYREQLVEKVIKCINRTERSGQEAELNHHRLTQVVHSDGIRLSKKKQAITEEKKAQPLETKELFLAMFAAFITYLPAIIVLIIVISLALLYF